MKKPDGDWKDGDWNNWGFKSSNGFTISPCKNGYIAKRCVIKGKVSTFIVTPYKGGWKWTDSGGCSWYHKNKVEDVSTLHRLDGPAIETSSGSITSYYLHGKGIDFQRWLVETKKFTNKEDVSTVLDLLKI